jgi:hypothetical protein
MTTLAGLVRSFAALLTPHAGNGSLLQQWIGTARAADLPHLHAFTNGLDLDIQATRPIAFTAIRRWASQAGCQPDWP